MNKYEVFQSKNETKDRIEEPMKAHEISTFRYTVKDFYDQPEGWKGELIDGIFYDMSSPTIVHQVISFLIASQLRSFVQENHEDCIVLPLPQDTQLNCDDYTIVEPDISVVCDKSKLRKHRVFGAPDFIAEILSPSTASHDRFLKLLKYMEAGVREYWIVDPATRTIMVYAKDVPIVPMTYTFDDEVPVSIWGGECKVGFAGIARELEMYALLQHPLATCETTSQML